LIRDGLLAESIGLGKDSRENMALLAHSVGAGLSIYVAAKAAAEGTPFKGVVALAPLTAVVDRFSAEAVLDGFDGKPPLWPVATATTTAPMFLVQFGLIDSIAPFWLACRLKGALTKRFGGDAVSQLPYIGGTHVGFQDQVFLADKDLNTDILPWLNRYIALLALGLPGLVVTFRLCIQWIFRRPDSQEVDDIEIKKGGMLSVGIEDVKLETDEQSLAIYQELLLVTTALTVTLGLVTWGTWERYPDSAIRWLPLVLCVLTGVISVAGAIELPLNRFYVDPVQREGSKVKSAEFICKVLGIAYTRAD
jgi:hypothetical protein